MGRGERPDFPGLAWMEGEELRSTGYPPPPERFETIADRNLVHNYSKMVGHSTLWPQVHASRGCPHNCDYCALVRHFGRRVRTRSPENVVADIRESIRFFHRGHVRLAKDLWLTDDNFFADRDWAMSVLRAIVDSGIRYRFNVQARYEVGFDDEMLDLLRQAGFFELDLGIEFLDDASFATYHKKSTRQEIIDAIRNIRAHGLSVRGLFILGSDDQEAGVGDQLADFVIQNHIQGTLIQCMYFVPGTPGIRGQPGPAAPPGLVEIQRQRRPLPPPHDPLPAPTGAHPGQPENLLLAAALLRPGAGGPHPQATLFGGIFLAHERAQRFEKGATLPQADLRTGRVRASLEARTLFRTMPCCGYGVWNSSTRVRSSLQLGQ